MSGTPPPTAASKRSRTPLRDAAFKSSGPCAASNILLAVTTDVPCSIDLLTHSYAGVTPPTTSTTTSGRPLRTSSKLSVQTTDDGTQSARFRVTPRLKTCVSWSRLASSGRSTRIRATDAPTVPKPRRAMRSGLPALDSRLSALGSGLWAWGMSLQFTGCLYLRLNPEHGTEAQSPEPRARSPVHDRHHSGSRDVGRCCQPAAQRTARPRGGPKGRADRVSEGTLSVPVLL